MKAGTYHHTPETLEKMRAAMLGKPGHPLSPEVRAKISAALKGRHHTPEVRAKISAARKGKPLSPEHRARIRASMSSLETREKLRQANLGKHYTPETRAKLGASLARPEVRAKVRAAMSRPEVRAKLSAANLGKPSPMLGKHLSPEHKAKIRAATRAAWSRPEYREKLRQANLGKHLSPETRAKLTGPNAPNWKGGISFEPYCKKFNNDFKERVRGFWEYRCGLCGKTQAENGQALSVHHVSYQKRACCDDEVPRYFIPLCASCHGKTGKDRGHWQKVLSRKIDKKFNGRCYFRQGEVLTSWGVKA